MRPPHALARAARYPRSNQLLLPEVTFEHKARQWLPVESRPFPNLAIECRILEYDVVDGTKSHRAGFDLAICVHPERQEFPDGPVRPDREMRRSEGDRSVGLNHVSIKPHARLDRRPRDVRAVNLTGGEVDQHTRLLAFEDRLVQGRIARVSRLVRDRMARPEAGDDCQSHDVMTQIVRQM